MKQRDPLSYGIFGALIGGAIVWFLATNVVNSNMTGMMRLMGIQTQKNTSQQTMMGNIDEHFIEQMIPHHEAAISMADIALQKAGHPEIKSLAQDIKRAQSEEISVMKGWYKNWFGSDIPENPALHGMMSNMMGRQGNVEDLNNASNFDKAFIEEMIPHHQMAVMMATMLKNTTSRPEMKQLAQNIIDAQTKEVNNMREWYKDWGYQQ